jgi:hypothetical protein
MGVLSLGVHSCILAIEAEARKVKQTLTGNFENR